MDKEVLIKWLMRYDVLTIETAIMYAENYLKYGTDITQKWETATQNAYAIHNAEKRGYYDCMRNMTITIPIETDDGHICCDACGCEIKKYQERCEKCNRRIDWEK